MSEFSRDEYTINGVKSVVLSGGEGEPLVFLHGGGTFHGWEFAKPWMAHFRVIIPHHPGFGESGDDDSISAMQDYVMHYLELFDALGLDKFNLVGFSLGGWMASKFASQHAHRIKKLVLVAPAGLRVPEAPSADLFRVPGEELPGMLVHDFEVIKPHLPAEPNVDFIVGGYREMTSVARLLWDRNYDSKLGKWLHRIKVPTLLVWGDEDKIIPVGQAPHWQKLIDGAQVKRYPAAGHLVLDEKRQAVDDVAGFLRA